MKKHIIVLLCLSFPFVIFAQKRTTAIKQSRSLVQKTSKENLFPGVAVTVAQKGKVIWSEGFGYADVSAQEAVNPASSLFRIGSISKPLTAAALIKLVEAKKIDLDAPIQTYVPAFPKKKYPVSLRQLAGHLAGIRHYRGLEFMSQKKYETVGEGLDIFKDDPLINEPGTQYAYSSYGWNLISAAIEHAAEEDFLSFMQSAVFDPLKLSNTFPDHADREQENRVHFYLVNNNEIKEAPYVDNSYKWAGGGFLSTSEDLIRFAHGHIYGDYLAKGSLEMLVTAQKTKAGKNVNYGLGWRSGEDKKGRKWFGHSGGSVGGTSYLLIFPEEELVVVTLVNLSSARLNNLPFRIAEQFLSNP
ncbi:MAG: beta-lactamase family protein [Saprospiraceae bacterium]|nr:beta-lactamase family protein [Saprospiraceae bacterium]